jgi:aspartyl-tRNA(Asn)/glutamyl-tRNA(Gln) amidotransferase subunit B
MRSKEEAHDYRYFPDPDLIPIEISEEWLAAIKAAQPELPDERRNRFMQELELPAYDAVILTSDRELADFFEETLALYGNAKKLSNWLMTELLRELREKDQELGQCPVAPAHLARLLSLIEQGAISGKIAKKIFQEMMTTGQDPETVIKAKNLLQMSDEGDLLKIVAEIVAANPEQVKQFQEGKTKVMGFFVGQLMQRTKGRANPKMANQLFADALNK